MSCWACDGDLEDSGVEICSTTDRFQWSRVIAADFQPIPCTIQPNHEKLRLNIYYDALQYILVNYRQHDPSERVPHCKRKRYSI